MIIALAKIVSTTPGTRISLAAAVPALANVLIVQGEFVALGTNTGKVYFGDATLNKTTLAGCYVGTGLAANQTLTLQDLQASQNRGTASFLSGGLGASMNANNIYFDVDNTGEGFGGYVTI